MDTCMIVKMVNGYIPTRKDIENMLYDVCESNHASCNDDCPIYELNGHIHLVKRGYDIGECYCFKNGKRMFDFIKSRQSKG